MLGLITDPGGAPLEGATLTLMLDPDPEAPALLSLLAPPAPITARSGARGAFRVQADRPGLLLAETDAGLGAAAPRCSPGQPLRLVLRPMAEVRQASGQPFRLWAACQDEFGRSRRVPMRQGPSVRLPEGVYECWWQDEDSIGHERLTLRSGETWTLAASADLAPRKLANAAAPSPLGFFGISFTVQAGALRLRSSAANVDWIHEAPGLPAFFVGPWEAAPPPFLRRTLPCPWRPQAGNDEAFEGTATLLLRRGREFAPVAHSRASATGDNELDCHLPQPPPAADAWILLNAPAQPAFACPWTQPASLAFAAPRVFAVQVAQPDGAPKAHALLRFVPALAGQQAGPTLAQARTDVTGRARLLVAAMPGRLAVETDDCAPLSVQLDAQDQGPVALRLVAGGTVGGLVRAPDGSPAAGVAVSVRCPSAAEEPFERTVLSGVDGAFCCRGTPTDQPLIVFAAMQRDGFTFSARTRLEGPDDAVTLVLQNEDPQLGPTDGR